MLLNAARAHDEMARQRLDLLLCVAPKNVYYISGHHSDWMFDVRWSGAAALPARHDVPACLFVQHGPLRIEIRRGEQGIRCSMIPSFFLITSAPNIEHRTKAGPPRNLN